MKTGISSFAEGMNFNPDNNTPSFENMMAYLGFTSSGKRLGEGAWGYVDEYQDIHGQKWAIKRFRTNKISEPQMEHRKLDLESVIHVNEPIPLSASSHYIVPRIVGKEFIAMPVYNSLQLEEGKGLEVTRAVEITSDIAHALAYYNTELGRVYCDLKPANVLVDKEGNALLTDFSASTFASPEMQSKDPRDNIGEICTRAPECFSPESHPDEKSDVYSLGAFFGKLLTGYFPHEKRLLNAKDPIKEIQSMIPLEANARTAEYCNEVPGAFYSFLRKCLYHNPGDRYKNAEDANNALKKAIIKYERSKPKARALRFGLIALSLITLGFASNNYFEEVMGRWNLEQKVEQRSREVDFEHKSKIISLYIQKRDSNTNVLHQSSSREEWVEEGKLLGYIQRFSDEETAFAAYLNPTAVCIATHKCKSERYSDIEKTLYEIDSRIPARIEDSFSCFRRIPGGIASSGMEDRRNENKIKAVKEFEGLQHDYTRLKELETWEDAAYKRCNKDISDKHPGIYGHTAERGSWYFKNQLSKEEAVKYEELLRLREKFRKRDN